MKEKIFLIGGYDLEMLEIIKILDERHLKYFDNKLSWGASWNDYDVLFNDKKFKNTTFVGIELGDKLSRPKNSIDFDHHNDFDFLPSSLEQVARMIGYKLTKKQYLIAANDKNHIKGLQSYNATEEEIAKIREDDRVAQQVSEEMEQISLSEFNAFLQQCNLKPLKLVKTKLNSFTPLIDRLIMNSTDIYNLSLLVYNDNKLSYSGRGSLNVLNELKKDKLLNQINWYSGGGLNGFFGVSYLSARELELCLNSIQIKFKGIYGK